MHKLAGSAVVEESCYAIKGGSPQIKREGDDAILIFEVAEVKSIREWLKHINLFKIIGNIDISTESELLEVKVPMAFLATKGRTLFRQQSSNPIKKRQKIKNKE